MSKLDNLKKNGFTTDVEVDIPNKRHNWKKEKFNNVTPRNAYKLKEMLKSEDLPVPFTNFNTWLLLYKEVNPSELDLDTLDTYFEDYKNYYLCSQAMGRLHGGYSEYDLYEIFSWEGKEFTSIDNTMRFVDHSRRITIGDVVQVDVDLTVDLAIESARKILGDKVND